MTTPGPTLDERVTALETRLDTILPTLATKEDIARLDGKMEAMNERLEGKIDAMNERLEGKIDAMNERLEGKIDASDQRLEGKINTMEHRLLLRFAGITATLLAIAVAAGRFL